MAVTVKVKYLRSHYHLMNRKVRGLWTQSSQQELECPEEASQGPQHKTVPQFLVCCSSECSLTLTSHTAAGTTQQLRAMTALPGDPVQVPSTHMVTHNHL